MSLLSTVFKSLGIVTEEVSVFAVKGIRLANRGLDECDHAMDAVETTLNVVNLKAEHYESRARIETKADYIMEIVAIYRKDPELGELYISDPENLPDGVTADDIRRTLKGKEQGRITSHSSDTRTNNDTDSTKATGI
jgi:hypothetical protein